MQELGSTLAPCDMLIQVTLYALMTLHSKQALLICLWPCIPSYVVFRVKGKRVIDLSSDNILSVCFNRVVHLRRAIWVFLKLLFDALIAIVSLLILFLTAYSSRTSLGLTAEGVPEARLTATTAC